ncbi:unnamed protein product [Closterium sp. Yama58-4]|nr:unnamed protein product [Closterium sp. Yama58-4]
MYLTRLPLQFPHRLLPRFPSSALPNALCRAYPPTMASEGHNPDEEMTLADVELQLDAEELHLDDLPDDSLLADPPSNGAPAPKKLCTEGDVSDNAPAPSSAAPLVSNTSGQLPNAHALSAAPPATTVASPPSAAPPISLALATPSAAPVVSPSAADPPRQRASAAASGVPEDQADHADTSTISRNLRRRRAAISIPVMPRRRLAVVEILFPEAGAEANRADLITRISRHLHPFHFHDADDFKSLFPLTFHLPNSRSVVLKVYVNFYPRFTSAKAGGATTLTLRNVPPGYAAEDLRTFLMHQDAVGEPSSLADLQFFHQIKDPYEDMYLPIFTGIPLPPQDDPCFLRIPAVFNFEFGSPPAVLNISSHVCTFCGNNHRDADHEIFPTKSRQSLTNRQQLSVAQLQQADSKAAPLLCPLSPLVAAFNPLSIWLFWLYLCYLTFSALWLCLQSLPYSIPVLTLYALRTPP